jgi:excisionase family DNA binding protein
MNLQDAADALGVHYQTVYRWVRSGALAATKKGASYDVARAEVDRFMARRSIGEPPPPRIHVRDWHHHVDRLEALLVEGDELEARAAIDRLSEGGVPLIELCDELIAPALARVGDAWHRGRVSVAQEHRATAICERLLARVSTHPRGRPRGVAVVATVPGDEHSFPSAMAALALRDDRWRVHHLGANVPADDLVGLARDVAADIVVLSSTMPGAADGLLERLAELGCRVMVGEPGKRLSDLIDAARA